MGHFVFLLLTFSALVVLISAQLTSNKNNKNNNTNPKTNMPHGKGAVARFLSGATAGRLQKLAGKHGKTVMEMKNAFESDETLYLDLNTLDTAEGPEIFYVEPVLSDEEEKKHPQKSESNRRYLYGTDAFKLHSRPGASKIIYLDFDGHDLTGTAWSPNSYLYGPSCDWDGNPSSFSETEKKYIELIWSRVAEDFAPFDVDVTTELSCEGLITRSGSGDTSYGTRVLITPGIASIAGIIGGGGSGGVAYLGIYARTDDYYKPALVVFPERLKVMFSKLCCKAKARRF
jgi:hypothetical protein